jgi:hypothetical protein
MPAITAVLHTRNDALRLGRALETLYACDEILIIDHGSHDETVERAREYGARVIAAKAGTIPTQYLRRNSDDWVLLLDPRESLTESLAAAVFEWKSEGTRRERSCSAFSVRVREETAEGWVAHATPETRLVSGDWNRWQGKFPAHDEAASILEGELLRFAFP